MSAPRISYLPRQAITVTYRPPTNARGARYVAKCEARPRGVSVPYDYTSRENGMMDAVRALLEVMGWTDWTGGQWVGGGTADGVVFVWVEDALSVKAGEGKAQ